MARRVDLAFFVFLEGSALGSITFPPMVCEYDDKLCLSDYQPLWIDKFGE